MIWEPFEEFKAIQEEMERLFAKTRHLLGFENQGKSLAKTNNFIRAPISDVVETENSVVASFELPGADKKDIELNVDDSFIEVKVEKKIEAEVKKKGFYSYETRAHQFYRKLPLPAEVIAEKTKATYKNGMLRIEIPKKKQALKKKRIEIE